MISDPTTVAIAQSEMQAGEKLLWSGKPDPIRACTSGLRYWALAIPLVAVIGTWFFGADGPNSPHYKGLATLLLPLAFIGVAFVLMLAARLFPIYRRAQKAVYAISNQRVLVIETGKTNFVQSHGSENLIEFQLIEKADRSGDLVFAQMEYTANDGNRRTAKIRFKGIPEVRAVETLMRETFRK